MPEQAPVAARVESRRPKWLIAILAIVGVFALGGGAYILTSGHQTAAPDTGAKSKQSPQNQSTSHSAQPPTPTDSSLTQYVSNGSDLGLRFSYPSSWNVTPPSNSNSNDQPITLTSPVVSLESATGTTPLAKLVVTIRPGGTTAGELAGDKATAGQASYQIAYDRPTSVQHQYPFLTFIHLSGGSNPQSLFEEVMITGVTSFAKDQAIPQGVATQFDPLITVRVYACKTQTCASDAAPLSLTNANWSGDPTCQQALAILKSLQIG